MRYASIDLGGHYGNQLSNDMQKLLSDKLEALGFSILTDKNSKLIIVIKTIEDPEKKFFRNT